MPLMIAVVSEVNQRPSGMLIACMRKIQEGAFRLIADARTRLEYLHSCFLGQYLRPALSNTYFAVLRSVTTFTYMKLYAERVSDRPIEGG